MLKYLVKRILQAVPLLLLITILFSVFTKGGNEE